MKIKLLFLLLLSVSSLQISARTLHDPKLHDPKKKAETKADTAQKPHQHGDDSLV